MRTTSTCALLIILALTTAGCAQQKSTTQAVSPTDRPMTIALSPYAGLLRSVSVTLGTVTHSFIFDTGGGETVITPELASAIGCRPYGRAVGLRAGGEQVAFEYCDDVSFRLGDVPMAPDRLGVFDLKSVLPPGAPPADGVVSLRSFRLQPVTIDLAMGRITVETARSLLSRTTGMRPLTIRVATGPTGAETTVYIAGRVGGQRVWFLLDSGNGDPLLLAPHVARVAGLQGASGEALVDFDGLGPIRLAARSSNIVYDGVLGAGFMEGWIFTLDLASSRAWAAPTEKPKS